MPNTKATAPDLTPAHQQPVTTLKGVGPRLAARLQKLHIHTVQDVLFHLPLRYENRHRRIHIGVMQPGSAVRFEAEVLHAEVLLRRTRSLVARISDGSGQLTLRFFHFNKLQRGLLTPGNAIQGFGEVRAGPTGLEIIHPEFNLAGHGDAVPQTDDPWLTPVYPATEGIHQLTLRKLVSEALRATDNARTLTDHLPPALSAELGLTGLAQAVNTLHRMPIEAGDIDLRTGRHPAQQRLIFEEILAHSLSLRTLRARVDRHPAAAIRTPGALAAALRAKLPFQLTAAQRRVIDEALDDLAQPRPMQRLVQGDVGSGKTLVAALCALAVIEAGFQVALMAPTELLAEQHIQHFQRWLAPLDLPMAWLTGKQRAAQRRDMLAAIADGQAKLIIGTHALFQDAVAFHDLALVIVDEQHRFGVHQRLRLREKGADGDRYPHQLIMTATPIPRTLAMTSYADLDVSVIDALPPGRTPVTTIALPETKRDALIARIGHALQAQRQIYWVCTLIEASEQWQAQNAEDTAQQLQAQLPGARIGLVHGRLSATAKHALMQRFQSGDLDVLVATTVIEVGVDVPNASLMIIENAERLGLSQLHQLRGRVGRGCIESACVLLYKSPLSATAKARLKVMRATNDGFQIAEEDLRLRGPGEVLGTRQTGLGQLRIADLMRDAPWLDAVRRVGAKLLRDHPAQVDPLIRRWIGEAQRYADV